MEERAAFAHQQNPAAFLFGAARNHALNRMRGERVLGQEIARYDADVDVSPSNDGAISVFGE